MSGSVPDSDVARQLQRLRGFRQAVYDCFTGWPDALFETMDALLCHPGRLESLPYLSLEPVSRRGHGSVYAALAKGGIDATALAGVLMDAVDPAAGLVFAADCSQWPRPDAPTSGERTLNYDAAKDTGGKGGVVTAGWWCQWLVQTGTSGSSWTHPVEVTRISPTDNHNVVAAAQIRALLARLPARATGEPGPIVCMDGDYSAPYLGGQFVGRDVQIVVRVRRDGVMLADPPPRVPGTNGRPQVHGPRMKLNNPATWRDPDEVAFVPAQPDGRGGRHAALSVTAWHRMHPYASESPALQEPGNDPHRNTTRPVTSGSVIWICSADPGMKPIWLFWAGPPGSFDLDRVWRAYLRRYDIEQLFRFIKQYLAWTRPRVRTPEQAERWSWLVAVAYVHLVLARGLVAEQCLPWERPGSVSPLRVKRGFRRVRARLGTPAKPPKPSRPGPGRPPGRTSTPATRHPIVRKTVTT